VNLVGDATLAAADAAREAGNSPNTVMAAAASIVGKGKSQAQEDGFGGPQEQCGFVI